MDYLRQFSCLQAKKTNPCVLVLTNPYRNINTLGRIRMIIAQCGILSLSVICMLLKRL